MTSSQRERRDWDYGKTYSWHSDPAPARDLLPHVFVIINDDGSSPPGIHHEYLQWCREHCQGAWAWWFDSEQGYIGFADEQERLLFVLCNQ